ncbi:hypothetical protein F8M41_020959 [Gigaspora margarita]|uniref:Uncharacterized protein n=1 Tax=Gigaspora margarita TaxID=4874 RepID=A0A8H4AHI9_GIGMA|nr:hypothetical protein F8M41_020959 [Gigaspora margarita]
MGIYGYAIVIQCKAYFNRFIQRMHVNEVETAINVGDFNLGVLVGAEASRIQRSAYRAVGLSKQAIIIATLIMCDKIKEAIINLLRKKENRLIEENKFNLNYYVIYKSWCFTMIFI